MMSKYNQIKYSDTNFKKVKLNKNITNSESFKFKSKFTNHSNVAGKSKNNIQRTLKKSLTICDIHLILIRITSQRLIFQN